MNFKNLFFVSILIPGFASAMDTTFQTPSIAFAKPRFARNNLTTLEMYISHNQADSTFNSRGNIVPYLTFAGPETILNGFTTPQVSENSTQICYYTNIQGQYFSDKLNFGLTQNIGQNWFISGHTNIIWHKYRCLKQIPINSSHSCLYIERDWHCGFSYDTVHTKTIGPTYATFGYTNSLQHFKHLDFLDVTVQTGLWIPEIFHSTYRTQIFQPLPNKMYNIGIPIQINTTIGLYDWLNIGGCALLIPFINSTQNIPVTTSNNICNTFFLDQKATCSIHSEPFLYVNAYLEAEQFIPHVTFMAGISYMKQGTTTITCLEEKFAKLPCRTNLFPWEICNLTISLELDLAKEKSHVMPRISFTYVRPLYGINALNTSAYAGQFGIEIRWDF